MSADLDAIAREHAVTMHANSYLRNGVCGPNQFIEIVTHSIRKACEQAIAQDRKTRGAEYDFLGHLVIPQDHPARAELVELRQQLAQQSAALDHAKSALGKWEAVHDDMFGFFCSNGMLNRWGKSYDCTKFNEAVLGGSAALAQLAEAPREANRALTSGEAVEETVELLKDCMRWHQGDKWRNSDDAAYRQRWQEHHDAIDAGIQKLRAPSRTEREDTAPEVGGKESEL